jgi:hypothetical protein
MYQVKVNYGIGEYLTPEAMTYIEALRLAEIMAARRLGLVEILRIEEEHV